MSSVVIRKLFDSFDELERSINAAKRALMKRDPVPLRLLRRLNEYEKILVKQRRLAQELCRQVASENWEEVSRHQKLINAFSALIYNDAMSLTRGILTGGNETFEVEDRVSLHGAPDEVHSVADPGSD